MEFGETMHLLIKTSMVYRKRRQIFFTQGFFSLVLALPLGLFLLDKLHAFDIPRVIEIICYDPNGSYVNIPKIDLPHNRTYSNFTLTGDSLHDAVALNMARHALREFKQSGSFETGVHYRFSDQSKYESLVRALDTCGKEQLQRYLFYKNDLWIF